jgi:hypothetical protein
MVLQHSAGPVGTDAPVVPQRAQSALDGLRAARQAVCTAQAEELRWAAQLARDCQAEARERLRELRPTASEGVDDEALAESLAVATVSCALGIGDAAASSLVHQSGRLTTVLPEVLAAWQAGVLDLSRVRVVATATEVLDDETARVVARGLLAEAGSAPWEGPAPRSWRRTVDRAVVRADQAAAARRRAAALAARRVRAWSEGDGTGVLQLCADASDIAMVDQVVTDLASALPATDDTGARVSLDQRRSDAMVNVFRSIREGSLARYPHGADPQAVTSPTPGDPATEVDRRAAGASPGFAGTTLPRVPVRRVHDLGLVLHADTMFGDGPRAEATGEQRGLGAPLAVDSSSARWMARRHLNNGGNVQVMVVDASDALAQVVCLDNRAARGFTTRADLHAAVRAALAAAPALSTPSYEPTEAIARHVRAEAPTCSFYDCPRQARSCDLDHDTPWPRGPTAVTNLDPKCRRHHQLKTNGLARSQLRAGPGTGARSVQWRLAGGVLVTTAPQPLPGCGETPAPG